MALPKHKLTPKSQRSKHKRLGEPIFGTATGPCIFGCNYVARDCKDLEDHCAEKHVLKTAPPKMSKTERAKRDLMLSAIWMNACPHCGDICDSREQLIEHSRSSHDDDLASFAVEMNS